MLLFVTFSLWFHKSELLILASCRPVRGLLVLRSARIIWRIRSEEVNWKVLDRETCRTCSVRFLYELTSDRVINWVSWSYQNPASSSGAGLRWRCWTWTLLCSAAELRPLTARSCYSACNKTAWGLKRLKRCFAATVNGCNQRRWEWIYVFS